MAVGAHKFTFTKSTNTSVPVDQSVTFGGLNQTPKAIIFFSNGGTAASGTYENHTSWSFGWCDNQGGNAVTSGKGGPDANADSIPTGRILNNACISISDGASTTINDATSELARANIKTVDSDGFTITWTKNNAVATNIHGIAFFGDDITNTKVLNVISGAGSSDAFTGAGFQPTFALGMGGTCTETTAFGPFDSANPTAIGFTGFGIGAAKSTTKRWNINMVSENGGSATIVYYFRTDCMLTQIDGTTQSYDGTREFSSFTANGITLTNSGTIDANPISFLLFKGGDWDTGTFRSNTAAGDQVVSTANATGTIQAVLLLSPNDDIANSTTATSTHLRHSIGAAANNSGTTITEGCFWNGMQGGASTMVTARANLTNKTIRMATEAATMTSSTTNMEANVSAMGSTSFTINITTAATVGTKDIAFITLSGTFPSAGAQFNRSPTAETVTISEASLDRVKSALRVPTTEATTVSEASLTRTTQAFRVPSSDSITVTEASLTRSRALPRVPSADSITVADSSTTRMLSAKRVPTTEVVTPSDSSLTRILSASRSPSSDSVTTSENLSGGKAITRVPSTDSITIADSSLTRLLSSLRVPSSDNITTGETLIRVLSATRSPTSDSITVADSSTTQKITRTRVPTADTITINDSSLARMLSARRVPSSDSITVLDSSLSRMLSLLRVPASDSITTSENVSAQKTQGAQTYNRAPTAENITITDSSLTRILSALRVPSVEVISAIDSSLTRILSAIRVPSTEVVTTSESLGAQVSGRISRSVQDTVIISDNLSRMLSATRVPTADTVNLNEQVSRIIARNRVPPNDSISISDGALTRVVTRTRSLSETPGIVEASLTRLLSAARSVSDTTVVSEVQSQISLSRRLEETVAVTEPIIQRIVTAIRQTTDSVDIDESVFFQTFHKFVFDSVVVAEQLFSDREQLGGSMSYATPAEVRPLLGNIGGQRTDAQITLAIDSAFDEINRRTGRQPPNEWKDTENDFGIVKKICRFKAALEMAVGIKDFDDREWMQKEIEEMFKIIEEGEGEAGAPSTDIVGSSPDTTYALNPEGIIWSVRYPNLKKRSSSGENDTTINPAT